MTRLPPFEAVLFDLDGTLVATDRFWVEAARTGARRAFFELGIERELPTRAEWMSVVGLKLEDGFRNIFPDLEEAQLMHVLRACEEEEHLLLSAGGAGWMPGARAVLEEFRDAGVQLGIASNCGQGYIDHMFRALDLGSLVQAGYCLDTPGIQNKSQMLARLLTDFGTRSAIMVGDRMGDRNAAWANGLPHVHCAFGFAGASEIVEAEATIEDMGELPKVLARRSAWIEAVLEQAGVGNSRDLRKPFVLGITGDLLAGKTLFAQDVARLLRERGIAAETLGLEEFRAEHAGGEAPAAGLEAFDLERLESEILAPHSQGASVRLPAESRDAPRQLAPGGWLILAGPFLLDPRLQSRLDSVLYLEISEEVLWRRLAARQAPEAFGELRTRVLPAWERHRERYSPQTLANLVLDASNPLGPPNPADSPVERGGEAHLPS